MSNNYFTAGQTTSSADPWSDHGYADWKANATAIRREWLRMMGLTEHEIDENCDHSPPTDIDEELAQYNAMFGIQERNA